MKQCELVNYMIIFAIREIEKRWVDDDGARWPKFFIRRHLYCKQPQHNTTILKCFKIWYNGPLDIALLFTEPLIGLKKLSLLYWRRPKENDRR